MSPIRRFARHFAAALVAIAVLLGHQGIVSAQDAPPPDRKIAALNETLLTVMKNADGLAYSGRFDTLSPVLRDSYDFKFWAQYSVGEHWKDLTDKQRQTLIDAFSRFTISTYASRFNGYSGEMLKVTGVVDQKKNYKLVKSDLTKSDGEKIALNYLMRKTKQGWLIVDVFQKGTISELARTRSDYTGAIGAKGFDGLIRTIERKIAAQAAG